MSNADKPIACTLTPGAFLARVDMIQKLIGRALLTSRRDGRRLHLTFAPEAREDVAKVVALERECCAFLDFDMHDGKNVELTITVPGGHEPDELLRVFAPSAA